MERGSGAGMEGGEVVAEPGATAPAAAAAPLPANRRRTAMLFLLVGGAALLWMAAAARELSLAHRPPTPSTAMPARR